jgi:HlyD family secretion protein
MSKYLRILPLLSLLIISSCNENTEHVALGTLERDRIAHAATTNEVIVALPVKPGSLVEKGELLVQLDDTQQKAHVARAEAELAKVQASLDKLHNGARPEEVAAATAIVSGSRATLLESESKYLRTKNLSQKSLASKADLDLAIANRDASQANLQSAIENLLVLTNGTREEDLRFGQANVDAAIATLASEQKMLADLKITSTRNGILDNLPWNLGERVTMGSPIAVVLAGKSPYARVYIPEPYRIKIHLGDSLEVRVDGLEKPVMGTVRWISTDPAFTPYYALNQEERARLMYLAEIQLPDSSSDLANGVPAQVVLP